MQGILTFWLKGVHINNKQYQAAAATGFQSIWSSAGSRDPSKTNKSLILKEEYTAMDYTRI